MAPVAGDAATETGDQTPDHTHRSTNARRSSQDTWGRSARRA
jgi:hypothetical protein